jgi:hypothetical protein
MVAYLQKQPRMSAAEYQSLIANASVMEEHGEAPMNAAPAPAPAGTAAAPVPASSTH